MKYLSVLLVLLVFSNCKSETNTAVKSSADTKKEVKDAVKGDDMTTTTAEVKEVMAETETQPVADPMTKDEPMTKVENVAKAAAQKVTQPVTKAVEKVAESKPMEKVEDKVAETKTATKTVVKEVKKEVEQKAESVTVEKTKAPQETKIATPAPVKEVKPAKISHADFDKLLSKFVSSSGKVNYKGLKSQVGDLDNYLGQLEATDISTLTRKEKLAFWINAYNAYTLKKIVSNYPLASITDLDGGKPWDTKWIKLDGRTLSLNNIENDIIRPTYNEPRIHFAVNCAAKSCPPLLNKAWTASNLEKNFTKQTKAYFKDTAQNKISADRVQLSKIFEWYAVDFGDMMSFVNKYGPVQVNAGTAIEYLPYDWSLNE